VEPHIEKINAVDIGKPDDESAPCSSHCYAGIELPVKLAQLAGRCEINEVAFDNNDMSLALMFGTLLWRRLTRMAEHYESKAKGQSDAVRSASQNAANDMRHILADTRKDVSA
jgi:hypothetical protein